MRKRKRRSRESKRESAWSGSTSASPTRSRIGRRIGGIANRPAISRRRSRAATRAGRGGRIPTGGCANPDGGTVVSVHVDTGRCSRTAGRGRSTPSPRTSCLAFESTPFYARVSIGRKEAFREPDWTTRRGLALSSGRARGLFVARAPPGAFSCPRRRKRDGHAVDRPRRIPDTRRSTSPGRLRPRLGRFTSRT